MLTLYYNKYYELRLYIQLVSGSFINLSDDFDYLYKIQLEIYTRIMNNNKYNKYNNNDQFSRWKKNICIIIGNTIY